MHLHHGIESDDGLDRRRSLAAAIGMNADIGRQHSRQRFHVTVPRGGEESLGELEATAFVHLEARPRLTHMGARAGGELAASSRITPDSRPDFVESEPEHIVQQESQHQRQGDVFLFLLFEHRIGKPRADIGLAPASRRLELIE